MAEPRRALLVDFGGVLTTDLFASFRAFCADEGLEPDALARGFRRDPAARQLLIDLEEGKVDESVFEERLGALLGVADPTGLIERLMARAVPDEAMITAVRATRAAGRRTGLVSNSWGVHRYDRAQLGELFDGVVLSGEVGIRKPAPRIYALAAEAMGARPEEVVFVDDLEFNLPPAAELGMATVHHTDSATTVARLEELLDIPLS